MTQHPKITIIGSGAWGTTLAYLLDRANHSYTIWSRKSSQSLESVIVDTDIIISAVSMKGVRPIIEQLKQIKMKDNALIVTATKGLDFETTKTPSQILQEAFPDHPIIVLCGPNLSKEIKRGLPAATVVSSTSIESAELVQAMFASDIFRVYVNNDPIGTELGGTLKKCDGDRIGSL